MNGGRAERQINLKDESLASRNFQNAYYYSYRKTLVSVCLKRHQPGSATWPLTSGGNDALLEPFVGLERQPEEGIPRTASMKGKEPTASAPGPLWRVPGKRPVAGGGKVAKKVAKQRKNAKKVAKKEKMPKKWLNKKMPKKKLKRVYLFIHAHIYASFRILFMRFHAHARRKTTKTADKRRKKTKFEIKIRRLKKPEKKNEMATFRWRHRDVTEVGGASRPYTRLWGDVCGCMGRCYPGAVRAFNRVRTINIGGH